MKRLHLPLAALLLCCATATASSPAKSDGPRHKHETIFLPNSQLAPYQVAMKHTLADLICENVTVENGKITTSLKKRDFREKGIPVKYYRMLLKELDNINSRMDKGNMTPGQLKKLLKEGFEQYRRDR